MYANVKHRMILVIAHAEQYQQSVKSDNFQMYDFGRRSNEQHYGQDTPPMYNLTTLATKTAIIYGGLDKVGSAGTTTL